jgi:hypothetical protein
MKTPTPSSASAWGKRTRSRSARYQYSAPISAVSMNSARAVEKSGTSEERGSIGASSSSSRSRIFSTCSECEA